MRRNYTIVLFHQHDETCVESYNMFLGTIPYRFAQARITAFSICYKLKFPLSRLRILILSGSLSFSQSVQPISLNSHFLPRCAAITACFCSLSPDMSSLRNLKSLSICCLGK